MTNYLPMISTQFLFEHKFEFPPSQVHLDLGVQPSPLSKRSRGAASALRIRCPALPTSLQEERPAAPEAGRPSAVDSVACAGLMEP